MKNFTLSLWNQELGAGSKSFSPVEPAPLVPLVQTGIDLISSLLDILYSSRSTVSGVVAPKNVSTNTGVGFHG